MQARKVAYIVALLAVELLAPSNAEAGGVQEYMEPIPEVGTITITQEEYRDLLQDQILLQMYESGEKAQGNAVSLVEANQIVEEALAKIDALQEENAKLTALLEAPVVEEEIPEVVIPETSFLRYGVGGGIMVDMENIGAYIDAEYMLTKNIGVTSMLAYFKDPVFAVGIRYHL